MFPKPNRIVDPQAGGGKRVGVQRIFDPGNEPPKALAVGGCKLVEALQRFHSVDDRKEVPRMAARTHGFSAPCHPWVRAAIRGLIARFIAPQLTACPPFSTRSTKLRIPIGAKHQPPTDHD
ncbi:hypothetical protein CKO51_10130 [Rhodopirellula sp. SM50]|nr:hypothetical protein CKO51_10130 [Rhodopirellula sp. SM50]